MIGLWNLKNRFFELRKSEFASKVIGGTFFLTIGTVTSKLLMAIAYVILARILTPEEYGEYGMINSTVSNFIIFASLGIGLTTTKYISENKDSNSELASGILGTSLLTVLILGIITSSLLLIFNDFIALQILKSESIKPLLKYAAAILVLTAFNSTQIGALLGLQGYRATSISNISQGVLVTLGIIMGGYYGKTIGAVFGNLLALLCLSFVIQLLLRKENKKFGIKPKLNTWKGDLETIYKFALPASLSSLISSPAMWILYAMLVRTPEGYYQMGIYSAVLLFPNAIRMLNGSLNNVLLPIFLSKETSITAKKEFFNYFGAWIIAIVIGLPFITIPELVPFFVGPKYPKDIVVTVLGYAMVSTLIIALKQGISRDLILKNKMWLSVFSMGQWALSAILLFYLLKKHGAIGFAASIALSYLINLILFVPFFVKMKISPSYIFYSKNVIIIWISLFAIIFINLNFNSLFRITFNILLTTILTKAFIKLYRFYKI